MAGPKSGRRCHFPFEYKGKAYSKCILEDSKGIPWCATTPKFSKDQFGYCDCRIQGIDKYDN